MFDVIAPNLPEPDYNNDNTPRLDESGNPLYQPLGLTFDFSSLDDENECSESVFYESYGDITIEAVPDVYITGAKAICIGGNSQLSRWIGGTWESNNPAVATVDSQTGKITGVSKGTTTFSFTVEETGCVAISDEITVISSDISGPDVLCVGKTITLSASTGNGTWESSNTSIATIAANGTVTGIAVGTVDITFTDVALGCSTTISLTVNEDLTPSFDFGATLEYCKNAIPVNLPTVSNNGINGTWVPATISTFTPGKIVYTFTPATGECVIGNGVIELTVTVSPPVVPSITISATVN
jgi:hypothetical protein